MRDPSTLRPLRDRALVERVFEGGRRGGSYLIELPRGDMPTRECVVRAVGDGERIGALGLRPGDRVIVRGNAGKPARWGMSRGDLYLSVSPDEVEAVVEGENVDATAP